ncbi:MAG: glutamate synthase-related protein [bacterium]
MPKKYHIPIKKLEPRFHPVSKFCTIEMEGCLGCLQCVKRTSCVYDVYKKRKFDPEQIVDTADTLCLNCMRCIQECKKGILSKTINPLFKTLGDDYWTPDLIERIWKQAESGKIPVSGAGYNGPFSGPGFDRMWTDMSEIVRPTRDGIHGREYISTVIDLGRRPINLKFDQNGNLKTDLPHFLEIPIPMILDIPMSGGREQKIRKIFAHAADIMGTFAVAGIEESTGNLSEYKKRLIVKLDPDLDNINRLDGIPIVEIPYSEDVMEKKQRIKSRYPDIIVSIRLPLDENARERTREIVSRGGEIIHLQASPKGRGLGVRNGDFVTTLMIEVHQALVDEGIREQVSLLISGGIAMAEHVAKIIICGADGVGVDLALLIALECRIHPECNSDTRCPVKLDSIPVKWGSQRILNLFGSWHSQLIEVLGAMGLREIRRLRGETGRAMFFEDLEQECFSPIFKNSSGKNRTLANPVNFSSLEKVNLEKKSLAAQKGPSDTQKNSLKSELPKISYCASRFRNPISKYRVIRTSACIACGKCAEICSYGVHRMGGTRMLKPLSHLCRGSETCRSIDRYCADYCPADAIKVGSNPLWETVGDFRWTADLIVSTWIQAETGRLPEQVLEYRKAASGGGFDRMEFVFPESPPDISLRPGDVDLSIPLNRRGDGGPRVTIGFPIYGGGMSFGAIGLSTMLARARAYKAFNSFTCTGEGGYPDALAEYKDNVITQVATGLFGVREETIKLTKIVEFKYAQGAKPGLGGHLLGDKVTPAVAKMREAVVGSALFSPFPFHSVYSVEDHKKHVDWIKMINPEALVSVKVSTPTDVDMVAVGSYYAGAHIIHLDGSYGGTGAAPDIAKKNIAMPIEYAIPKVHRFLMEEGIRDQITLIASGGLRTAWDVAKAIALGADGVVICTPEMVALECIRCGNCESGRGCPRGIASTDPELSTMYDADWGTRRLINLFYSWYVQLQEILWRLGLKSAGELVGRTDLLMHLDYVQEPQPVEYSK